MLISVINTFSNKVRDRIEPTKIGHKTHPNEQKILNFAYDHQ